MADVVISLFENSGSFASAKSRIGFVEQLKVWDKTYSSRLVKAVEKNDQVSGSWGVPEQVKALVAKWDKA